MSSGLLRRHCCRRSQKTFEGFSIQSVILFSTTLIDSPKCCLFRPNNQKLLLRQKPYVQCNSRWLSSTSVSSDINSQLRNMIKPFLLKCHPDVHVAPSSKQINLAAVQNLNSYLDFVQTIATGKYKHQNATTKGGDNDRFAEIDFVILVNNDRMRKKKKKNDDRNEQTASRRKVEIVLPPQQLCINLTNNINSSISTSSHERVQAIQQLQERLFQHARHELVKLLRIAGLSDEVIEESSRDIHDLIVDNIVGDSFGGDLASEYERYQNRYSSSSTEPSGGDTNNNNNAFRRAHHMRSTTTTSTRPKTPFEQSRDKYTANIPWHNYRKLYDEAVAEMKADSATHGLISKHEGRRRAMIARILSNIRIQKSLSSAGDADTESDEPPPITFTDQLIAFRRLTILLDTNFDKLQMEEFGQMWENSRITLTAPRPYNTSRSALLKRKKADAAKATSSSSSSSSADRAASTAISGFAFTLHPNLSVTISIPIDFQDDELIEELNSNVWDFYNFIGDGTEEFFQERSSI